ncbi:UNVERIFIED_CONTAM: hypothetical protein HDU68_000565 [Siphonaria sp. JEL0065]|nr:hypothetical protein HDU68_000565 [Siphonaria sp. JEL0065]
MLRLVLLCLTIGQLINAHGYMISPNGLNGALGAVRGYGGSIDTLQNPGNPDILCKNLPKSKATQVSFGKTGDSHTVGLSISARHPGPCTMQIIDATTLKIVEIGSQMNCATQSPDSVRFDFTFKLTNMEQVTCKDCILRFVWSSTNLVPKEFYQTCADIVRVGGGPVKPPVIESPKPSSVGPSAVTSVVPPQPPVQPSTTLVQLPKPTPLGPGKSTSDCKQAGEIFCKQECGPVMIQCVQPGVGIETTVGAGAVCKNGLIDHSTNC